MQLGSMFISNCNNALHTSIQLFMLALYLAACHTPEAATTVSKCSWDWTQKGSETCRALLQLLIYILPSCIKLVLYIYILYLPLCYIFYGIQFS